MLCRSLPVAGQLFFYQFPWRCARVHACLRVRERASERGRAVKEQGCVISSFREFRPFSEGALVSDIHQHRPPPHTSALNLIALPYAGLRDSGGSRPTPRRSLAPCATNPRCHGNGVVGVKHTRRGLRLDLGLT